MKTEFINNNCFLVKVDNQKEILKGIKAIKTLGYKIERITLYGVCANFFFYNYYKKYDTYLLCDLQNHMRISQTDIEVKNDRLYVTYNNKRIILPIDLCNILDDKLDIYIYVE